MLTIDLKTEPVSDSPNNHVLLKTVESPVLQREGYTQNNFEKSGAPIPTMEGKRVDNIIWHEPCFLLKCNTEWTFAKQKWQRTKGYTRGDAKYDNAQILPGYNEKAYP